ncbi:MAG: hypothetical protein JJU29_16555 [Verrucomicrobia bacterium]|nr:hypothetical protein [Verrucomicrobiota bacterium]MCH8513677.1 hypothetical protein [Kiritimatiellia bacterium]
MSAPNVTGLVCSEHRFEYTVFTGKRRKDSGMESFVEISPAPPASEASAPPENVPLDSDALLAKHHKALNSELHVAVPAESTLLHVADFPSTDPEELEGMVELRAEDLTPFPMDRTYVGWELLSSTETESKVLIALAGHGVIDPLHETLRAHHLLPHRLDVDVLAWWRLLAEHNREVSRLLMIVEGPHSHLIVVDHGTPVAFASLGDLRGCPAEVLLEDLEIALAGVEADRGSVQVDGLSIWVRSETPEALETEKIMAAYDGHVTQNDLRELPELSRGLVLRGLEGGKRKVLDLAPPAWKEEEAMRATRKRVLGWSAALAALWLVGAIGLAVYVKIQENQLQTLRRNLAAQQQPVETVRDLSLQVRSLSQFTDRSASALEVLRVMAEAAPGTGGVVIRDMHYRKDQGVTFSGEARGDFFQFQETLSASEILRVEDFDTKQERDFTEFRVVTRWIWQDEDGTAGARP